MLILLYFFFTTSQAVSVVAPEPLPVPTSGQNAVFYEPTESSWYQPQYNDMFTDASEIMTSDLSSTTVNLEITQPGVSTERPLQDISHLILNVAESHINAPTVANMPQALTFVNTSTQQPPYVPSNENDNDNFWEGFDFSTFSGLSDSDDGHSQ